MTTNQTIDGVSRKSLEQALKLAAVFDDGGDGADAESARGVVWILRTLLDAKPEDYPPCDYCGIVPAYHPWHGSGLLAGVENPHIHACNECRHLLPACKPQGEPVAWLAQALGKDGEVYRNRATTTEPTMRDIEIAWGQGVIDRFTIVIRPLYTSQPAPVAGMLPSRIAGDHLNEMAQGWNACIDAASRPNDINQ